MLSIDSLPAPTDRDIRVVAMYKLFFGEEWLSCSVNSIIEHVRWLCFVLSDRAWSDIGTQGDRESILATVSDLKMRHPGRIFLLEGSWSNQLDHVRAGLDFARKCCPTATHMLYVDSDEVYPEGQLKRLFRYATDSRCRGLALHVSWYTFFRSTNLRVDPLERYRPLALFPMQPNVRFTRFRTVNLRSVEVPVRIHHFSYVRMSDERIHQKLRSFASDEAVLEGWYEKVWLNWHPAMRDFHPVKPRDYHALAFVHDEELHPEIVKHRESWHNMAARDSSAPRDSSAETSPRSRRPISLGVIVVTHNSAKHLSKCLSLASRATGHGIVVVDNASEDESIDLARRGGATVIQLGENTGYSKAANIGASVSHCDILCFLNPDCFVDRDTVEDAVAVIRNMPEACVVPQLKQGGKKINGRQPGYTPCKLLCDILETSGRYAAECRSLRAGPLYHDNEWSWPIGACMFVRREIFEAVGGFNENYFMYMEDVDLGRRLHEHGFSIVDLNRVVEHRAQDGSRTHFEHRKSLLDQARLKYAELNYGVDFRDALKTFIA